MKISSIKQDVDAFKFYLQNENDPLSIKAYSYEGESMASGWTPFSINLFKGKTKLEKSLREDFNASCFDDGLFFVTEDVAEALCKVTDFFEQLQVITDDGRCFYYMNLTRKIRSLFLNDRSELKICIVVGFINSMKVSLPMKLFLEMIFCLRITLLRKSF